MASIKIIETPRDGIQGLNKFISTSRKVDLINLLLKVGFDTVEVGSFVSEKAIPQLKDTVEVIRNIDLKNTTSEIMVLVANKKGAQKAAEFEEVSCLSFPFSISPTFLRKNINSGPAEVMNTVKDIKNICDRNNKELIVYLTMGFGNPYGDEWNTEIVEKWVEKIYESGIRIIPLSDTTGEANTEKIIKVYETLTNKFPDAEFGLHLHSAKSDWYDKLNAGYVAGCRRFDTVTGGLGGCPMTGKELLQNLDTLDLVKYCDRNNINTGLDINMLRIAAGRVSEIINY